MSSNQGPADRQNPQAAGSGADRRSSSEQPPNLRQYLFIGSFGVVAAIIMLVGLPLGALLVTQGSDCCHPDTLPDLITFWGAVLAAMLTLFGLLISGIYIFTAFKIDIGAKKAARDQALETAERMLPEAVNEAAKEFYKKYRSSALKDFEDVMEEHTQSIGTRSKSVKEALNAAEREAKEALALAESSKSDMKKAVEEFNRAAAEGREEMTGQASRIRELAIASEANINNAVDGVKRAAQNAHDAADAAQRSAQEAKNAADEAEAHARRASGGDLDPEST